MISERKGVSFAVYNYAVLKRDFQDVHPRNGNRLVTIQL